MRIAIVTDTWAPEENSLVSILKATVQSLHDAGHSTCVVAPEGLPSFSFPGCPELRFATNPYPSVERRLDTFAPEAIHIATEGSMGLAARRYCLRRGLRFTSTCHGRFPGFLRSRRFVPAALGLLWLRWFHRPSGNVLVSSASVKRGLEERAFRDVTLWRPGVDTERFRPEQTDYACIVRPLHLYVGSVSVERNVDDFLRLDVPGSKWVIGDGPQREDFERCYPEVKFLGAKSNEELQAYYNCADVLVYPGRGEAFALPVVEAMACGVPVAAYPAPGAAEVVAQGVSGVLDHDLRRACAGALGLDREQVRRHALRYSAELAAAELVRQLCPVRGAIAQAAVSSPAV